MLDYRNINYNVIKYRFINCGKGSFPYLIMLLLLLFFHFTSVFIYSGYCVVNSYNFFNIAVSISPICSYLLDIITICHTTINKMWYIFGGFVIANITGLLNGFNVFSINSKEPNVISESENLAEKETPKKEENTQNNNSET